MSNNSLVKEIAAKGTEGLEREKYLLSLGYVPGVTFQRGYKAGLAQYFSYPENQFLHIPYTDYILLCNIYTEETGIKSIPYIFP